jgi:hypothetical protein
MRRQLLLNRHQVVGGKSLENQCRAILGETLDFRKRIAGTLFDDRHLVPAFKQNSLPEIFNDGHLPVGKDAAVNFRRVFSKNPVESV